MTISEPRKTMLDGKRYSRCVRACACAVYAMHYVNYMNFPYVLAYDAHALNGMNK